MLDLLRKNTRTFGIYFMFAAIIVVFGFTFGAISPDQACGGQPGVMAQADLVEIDDTKIDTALVLMAATVSVDAPAPKGKQSDNEYRMTRFRNLGLIGPMSGGAFSKVGADVSPVSFIKFVDDLLEMKIVSAYARRLGMGVSAEELNGRLSLFTSNFRDEKTGRFDADAFKGWQARNVIAPGRFETFVREEILREKVIQLLVGEVTITDAELTASYRVENEKVKIDTITIDAMNARGLVPVSEPEIAEWQTANQEKLETEYAARKDTAFTTPKNWKLRGIRFDAADPAMAVDDAQKAGFEEERKELRTKAEGILADLRAKMTEPGVDEEGNAIAPLTIFAGFAAEHSDDDIAKAMGGAMKAGGYTESELGRPPFGPAVKDAVSAAAARSTLELVESGSAFWILYIDAVEETRTETLDAVRTKLARTLIQEDRAEAFKTSLADEVLAEAKKDPTKSLDDVAKLLNEKYGAAEGKGLSVRPDVSFTRLQEGQAPFIFSLGGRSATLVRDSFAATAENPVLPSAYTVEPLNRIVVARFKGLEELVAQTDDERAESKKAMTFERQRALYRGWYEDLLAKKLADGSVTYTSAYERERNNALNAFVQAGGVLPMAAAPAAPTAAVLAN